VCRGASLEEAHPCVGAQAKEGCIQRWEAHMLVRGHMLVCWSIC
jgi:hypothetical protein